MPNILITNNSKVNDNIISSNIKKYYYENLNYFEILEKTRDFVLSGHVLLTHPITSSIKPNETPYRTVLLSEKTGSIDDFSLQLVDGAIKLASNFLYMPRRTLTEKINEDFKFIDYEIIYETIKDIL